MVVGNEGLLLPRWPVWHVMVPPPRSWVPSGILATLLLWVATVEAATGRWCQRTVTVTTEEEVMPRQEDVVPCASLYHYSLAGWHLDRHRTSQTHGGQPHGGQPHRPDPQQPGSPTQLCYIYRPPEMRPVVRNRTVRGCCPGWSGPHCTEGDAALGRCYGTWRCQEATGNQNLSAMSLAECCRHPWGHSWRNGSTASCLPCTRLPLHGELSPWPLLATAARHQGPSAECLSWAGSRYRTFDGRHFHFSGRCTYSLATATDGTWDISIAAGHPRVLHMTFGMDTVVARGRNISVNSVVVPEGQPYLHSGIGVTWLGDWVAVASGLGVRVASDGHQAVTVTVEAELWGGTRGLCGPYNDDPTDDFLQPGGDVAPFATSFGNSWKIPGADSEPPCRDAVELGPGCAAGDMARRAAEAVCGKLLTEPFRECHDEVSGGPGGYRGVDPAGYYTACLDLLCVGGDTGPPPPPAVCEVTVDGREVTLPFASAELSVRRASSSFLLLQTFGAHLLWGLETPVAYITLQPTFAHKVRGLCGTYNWDQQDEFTTPAGDVETGVTAFANQYRASGDCPVLGPVPLQPCDAFAGRREVAEAACAILHGPAFQPCHRAVEPEPFLQLCLHDACSCRGGQRCLCPALAAYARECAREGAQLSWRNQSFCGMVATVSSASVASVVGGMVATVSSASVASVVGGMVATMSSVPTLMCTCQGGRWLCSQDRCPGECTVLGGHHYVTFDRRRFSFLGACAYILVQDFVEGQLLITAEHEPCDGHQPLRCLRSLSITTRRTSARLRGTGEVTVDGREVTLPFASAELSVRRASSSFLLLQTFGAHLLWGLETPLYQECVPPCGRTCADLRLDGAGSCPDLAGLCVPGCNCPPGLVLDDGGQCVPPAACPCRHGTRLYPPSGHIRRGCNPWCVAHAPCHRAVEPEPFLQLCLHDACSCRGGQRCLCPALAAYARECAREGAQLSWRNQSFCDEPCGGGQLYQECVPPCGRTCADLRLDGAGSCPDLAGLCVPGCNCPPGLVLDDGGQCVPPAACPCRHGTRLYPPGGHIRRGCNPCVCAGGSWRCSEAPCPVAALCPGGLVHAPGSCLRRCDSAEPNGTCTGIADGCVCPPGTLFLDGHCVSPEECPCHHGGRLYRPNDTIVRDCNTWLSIDWGMVPSEQCLPCHRAVEPEPFLQLCLHDACSCRGGQRCLCPALAAYARECAREGAQLSWRNQSFCVYSGTGLTLERAGLFLLLLSRLGLAVLWDGGTRVYVRLEPRHRGRVAGLCGNFDGDAENDFTSRQGVLEPTPDLFGNSWRLSLLCPEVDGAEAQHPCTESPHRATWARRRCSVLQQRLFAPCHDAVPSQRFYDWCIFDACGCDSGGDCECLCTAIATYAEECGRRGIHIRWRSQELCPLQCDRGLEYSACGPPCPPTCRDLGRDPPEHCQGLACLEGCFCPPGRVLHDGGCVDPAECPCFWDGFAFPAGATVQQGCRNCTCVAGGWQCPPSPSPCPSRPGCAAGEFSCRADGRCVPGAWLCDNEEDCPDGSDELCPPSPCAPHQPRCAQGQCLEWGARCDGVPDCPDGSDEGGCPPTACVPPEFSCTSGRCLPPERVCDGELDCGFADHSDEAGCSPSCGAGEFRCAVGRCVPYPRRCDGRDDCGDSSDERGCLCPPGHFQCPHDARCLPPATLCDGHPHCANGTDEAFCPAPGCHPSAVACGSGECVPRGWLCDGEADCPDGSDELGCGDGCPPGHFPCARGTGCVPYGHLCDGVPHCRDHSDESNDHCGSTAVPPCPGHFACADGSVCLNVSRVCDGVTDCPQGEDELYCHACYRPLGIATLPPDETHGGLRSDPPFLQLDLLEPTNVVVVVEVAMEVVEVVMELMVEMVAVVEVAMEVVVVVEVAMEVVEVVMELMVEMVAVVEVAMEVVEVVMELMVEMVAVVEVAMEVVVVVEVAMEVVEVVMELMVEMVAVVEVAMEVVVMMAVVEVVVAEVIDVVVDVVVVVVEVVVVMVRSCGLGVSLRRRVLLRGGLPGGGCTHPHLDTRACFLRACPVPGGWAAWGSWSPCDVECGGGVRSRVRSCSDPPPKNGGQPCPGGTLQVQPCNLQPCGDPPADGTPRAGCRCPPGLYLQDGGCVNASGCRCHLPGGQRPPGQDFMWGCRRCVCRDGRVTCQDVACATDCGWSSWSPWTHCDGGCGAGTQERFRSPSNPAAATGGAPCTGASREVRECHQPCGTAEPSPGWSPWTPWGECSAPCGSGEQRRHRDCASRAPGGGNCTGPRLQTRDCNTQPCRARCPADMVYRTAEECRGGGGPCPRLCQDLGAGVECAALCHDGCACPPGLLLHNQTCVPPHRCPCHYRGHLYQPGDTTAIDACNNCTCTAGVMVCGTEPCPGTGRGGHLYQPGDTTAIDACNNCTCTAGVMVCGTEPCPEEPWGAWSPWGPCGVSCGGGERLRRRRCHHPPCPGLALQSQMCNTQVCREAGCPAGRLYRECQRDEGCPYSCAHVAGRVGCVWGGCPEGCHCPPGTYLHRGACLRVRPGTQGTCLHGRLRCSEPGCRRDGGFGPWGPWSPCSPTCGGLGVMTRWRGCTSPPPANGGRDCEGPRSDSKYCQTPDCPVTAVPTLELRPTTPGTEEEEAFGPWSPWTPCSKTCTRPEAPATKSRNRTCSREGGCGGGTIQQLPCNLPHCAGVPPSRCECRDAGGQSWVPGSRRIDACTNCTCTGGRLRCTPAGCPPEPCPWSRWSRWAPCSVTCGEGRQARFRTPTPETGDGECEGPQEESRGCSGGPCPPLCLQGGSERQLGESWPQGECQRCTCTPEGTQCQDIPCAGSGGCVWGAWTPCSRSCGTGLATREAACHHSHGDGDSDGAGDGDGDGDGASQELHREARVCYLRPCPGKVSGWGLLEQAGGCVPPTQCDCLHPGGQGDPQTLAAGDTVLLGCKECVCQNGTLQCSSEGCQGLLPLTPWSEWTPCGPCLPLAALEPGTLAQLGQLWPTEGTPLEGTPAEGTAVGVPALAAVQHRYRTCLDPQTGLPWAGDGATCLAELRQQRLCPDPHLCQDLCLWSPWGPWGPCQDPCGGGYRLRHRGPCSRSCGGGNTTRHRECQESAGGEPCGDTGTEETAECNTQPCHACPPGELWQGPDPSTGCERSCRDISDEPPGNCSGPPAPGCTCQPGHHRNSSGHCVLAALCECWHRGQLHEAGSEWQEECETCRCRSGQAACSAHCPPLACPEVSDPNLSSPADGDVLLQREARKVTKGLSDPTTLLPAMSKRDGKRWGALPAKLLPARPPSATPGAKRPRSCSECGKSFRKIRDQKKLQQTHTVARPFSCRQCGRKLELKQKLVSHQKVHAKLGLGEPPVVPVSGFGGRC
ncbi:PREDICTED: SCO-spondin [Calidris pugnax]|uniref:SCO-spondin n=1 Tax=Calidris pugnax TaxID=198806 RepID=UPI00071DEAF1|nr:PREDICTED: SCO-spondin [Calidris pugnax]